MDPRKDSLDYHLRKPQGDTLLSDLVGARPPQEDDLWSDLERVFGKNVDLLVLNRAAPTVAESGLKGIPIALKDRSLY